MKRMMKKLFTVVLALTLVLGCTAMLGTTEARADETVAYICYADTAWSDGGQYWGGEANANVTATNAVIPADGFGQYTIGLEFAEAAQGCAFTDIQLDNGEALYPNAVLRIDEVTINGAPVVLNGVPYTSSDDGVVTRANLYNSWVGELPNDARTASGSLDDATPAALNPDDCASVSSMTVTFTLIPGNVAYINFADTAWSVQNWDVNGGEGVTLEPAVIKGAGSYSTKISFAAPTDGIAFAALMLDRGEVTLPKSIMNVDKILVNGSEIEFAPGYTTYDNDGSFQTRVNLYNEWVTELPEDVRTADGSTDVTPRMIDNTIAGIESIEVFFTLTVWSPFSYPTPSMDAAPTQAYICFADTGWTDGGQYWGGEANANVKATNAQIPANGFGTYTVGLEFTEAAAGCAFTDIQIDNGELMYPDCVITINEVTVNGAPITLNGTPYTSSDDGVVTRANLYNEWVGELPQDARTASGSLADATPTSVNKDDFASVSSMTVTFTLAPATQVYLDWADTAWSVQNWSADGGEGVKVEPATVYGPGSYSTKISFDTPCDGIAFTALIMDRGEVVLPYIAMTVDKILVNGSEIAFTPGYTTYDNDGSFQTRVNIYNEWVSELPEDVRTADGSMDVSPIMIDNTMTGIESVEVFFTVTQCDMPEVEEEEEAPYVSIAGPVDLDGTYNGYVCFQAPKYTFRDAYDNASTGYGTPLFNQITKQGDVAGGESIPATINDVVISGNGTYTASITGIEFPEDEFADQDFMNMIFLQTDIPNTGEITISDIVLKINGSTVELPAESQNLCKDSKDYMQYRLQSTYDSALKEIGMYTVPFTDIEITFTVSGFNYDNGAAAEEPVAAEPEPTQAAAATQAPAVTEAPAPAEKTSGSNTGLIIGIIAAVVVIAGACVYFFVIRRKK